MKKNWIVVVALCGILVAPSIARAHEGHPHKVTGTVSSVEGNNVMVKTADGKTVMVMLDGKTAVTRGKAKLNATAVKVGDRVVAEGPEENEMIMAQRVKLGELAAASKKERSRNPHQPDNGAASRVEVLEPRPLTARLGASRAAHEKHNQNNQRRRDQEHP
jgi:translation initiation factor IF-1